MALVGTHTRQQPRRNRPLEEVLLEQKTKKPLKVGKIRVKGVVLYSLLGVITLSLLAFANGYQDRMVCKDVSISLLADADNQFLNVEAVKDLIGLDGDREVIGARMNEIGLADLEANLENNAFIKQAEVYKSLNGVLYVEVAMREPIARIINANGGSMYLDELGYKFPTSYLHTANVPLVRPDVDEPLTPVDSMTCEMEEAMPVLKFLQEDPFWHAQISEVRIKENGELILYPEIGDIYIEFGRGIRVTEKFDNLKMFYHKVVKELGWKKYKGVSVKYRGQVVAKKRRR